MREPRSITSAPVYPSEYFGLDDAPRPLPLVFRLVRAAAEGILPLVILAAVVALFWEASVIGRIFAAPYGIDMIQRVETVTTGGGLVIALVIYLIAVTRTLQGVREHHRHGEQIEAIITLAFLTLTAIATLIPLLMALASPQHPAA
ncbi:MAG TPA: hypothetical protein VF812_09380 [Ktedonobacterales bacterium]